MITIDCDEDVSDLFVRFKHAEHAEGKATEDGKLIVYCDLRRKIAATENTNTTIV